ncbi:MAG TPA: hypothetical protein VM033_00985 [Gemmatimonadaceae bacterium]|nr:hypothetical protein [Gemmatimonadaceae bacterium]
MLLAGVALVVVSLAFGTVVPWLVRAGSDPLVAHAATDTDGHGE